MYIQRSLLHFLVTTHYSSMHTFRAMDRARVASGSLDEDLQWWSWLNDFAARLPAGSNGSRGHQNGATDAKEGHSTLSKALLFFRIFVCDHYTRIATQHEEYAYAYGTPSMCYN